ncbi:MAG: hypothetical protein ACKVOH_00315 [Chlamydiales bacterium]
MVLFLAIIILSPLFIYCSQIIRKQRHILKGYEARIAKLEKRRKELLLESTQSDSLVAVDNQLLFLYQGYSNHKNSFQKFRTFFRKKA